MSPVGTELVLSEQVSLNGADEHGLVLLRLHQLLE